MRLLLLALFACCALGLRVFVFLTHALRLFGLVLALLAHLRRVVFFLRAASALLLLPFFFRALESLRDGGRLRGLMAGGTLLLPLLWLTLRLSLLLSLLLALRLFLALLVAGL